MRHLLLRTVGASGPFRALAGWYKDTPAKDGLMWVDTGGLGNDIVNTNTGPGNLVTVGVMNGLSAYNPVSSQSFEKGQGGPGTYFQLSAGGTSKISFAMSINLQTNGSDNFDDLIYFQPIPGNGTGFRIGTDFGYDHLRARTNGTACGGYAGIVGTPGDKFGLYTYIATFDWTIPTAATMEFYIDRLLVGIATGDVSAAFSGPVTEGIFSINSQAGSNKGGSLIGEVIVTAEKFSTAERKLVFDMLQPKWGSAVAFVGLSTVDHRGVSPTFRSSSNITSGFKFIITKPCTITGVRLYWPGAADTVKFVVWDSGTGAQLAVDTKTVSGAGVFSLLFTTPAVLTDITKTYALSTYHTSTDDVYDYSNPLLQPFASIPPVEVIHEFSYQNGDANPVINDGSGAVALIEPVVGP